MIARSEVLHSLSDVIEAKASAESHNWTPLFFAVASGPNGHPELVSILVKKGADVNVRDTLGRTPLHYASELGQDDNLEMLLNHGADPNVTDTETKKSPLLLAIENGQFNSVQTLYNFFKRQDSRYKLDLSSWDSSGLTVLHYAAITQGNAALYLKFFVEQCKMNVFIKNRQGLTAREYAQKVDRFKYHRVVKLLRELEQQA